MLQGIELINCAKANAKQGLPLAAEKAGYQKDVDLFTKNLQLACQQIGVNIDELGDLITDQQIAKENRTVLEISPDSTTEL